MTELLRKIDDASRLEQFEIYLEIFTKCFNQRDMKIFTYFDEFLLKWQEFLSFEKKPNKQVRNLISKDFELFFRFIRASNNLDAFNKFLPVFLDNEKYLSNYFYLANIYDYFGYLMWLKHDIKAGVDYLLKALDIANKHCKPNELPGRYTNLGYLYEVVGDLSKAEYYYNEGLDFALKFNSINALKLAYNAMGRLYIGKNLFDKAIEYFEDSLSLYDREKDVDKVTVINNLAMCYRAIDDNKRAKTLYESLDKEWLLQKDPELYFSVQTNLGNILSTYKDFKQAEEKFLKSLDFAEKVKALDQVISIYISLGNLYNSTDRKEQGIEILEKALHLSIESKNHRKLKSIYADFADIYIEQNEYELALSYIEKLIEIAEEVNNSAFQIETLKKQAFCYEKLKDYKKACTCYNKLYKMQAQVEEEKKAKMRKDELKLVGKSKRKHFIFQGNDSLISRELSAKIGTNLIGKDPAMQTLINKVLLASSNCDASILIRGESGTGKDIIARIIHYSSLRKEHPFIAVNSGSFSPGIVNSALFGHKKGAFTGAVTDHVGYFEAAKGGTIFMDEIGEMPQDIQIALLRVLEDKKVLPIGSTKAIPVNFRLISATNVDINEEVKQGKLRLDFLNRINTVEINVPALRERKDDIPVLVEAFLDEISLKMKIKKPKFSISALRTLMSYDFPGNVRELRNMIENLMIFNDKKEITPDDIYNLSLKLHTSIDASNNLPTLNLEVLEKNAIIRAMKDSNNVKTSAAKLLGITPYALHRRIVKYGLV